jgi:hypothetical protein
MKVDCSAVFKPRHLPGYLLVGFLWVLVFTAGCSAQPTATFPAIAVASPTVAATATAIQVTLTATAIITPSPQPTRIISATLAPNAWQSLPVIPVVSDQMKLVYQAGLKRGNNPHAFSKIGDCGSTPSWFLGDFDRGPRYYTLGTYQDLMGVIQQFQGSYGRTSLAARAGYNASSVFTTWWADPAQCQVNETPLACEYRLQKPSVVFVMLGANDVWHPDQFEPQMSKIIEISLQNGIIPILSTKIDNQEGDNRINATIAALANHYQVPLWNFWAAVQTLPDKGLQEDGVHLTWSSNHFDDPQALKKAWPLHNLTALQALNAVWRSVTSGG